MWMPVKPRWPKRCCTRRARCAGLAGWITGMLFSIRPRWNGSGASRFFPSRRCLTGGNVTLLDTPGHVDFSAEMERTLQVLDYAVLVISGTDGVQAHTHTLWRLLARHQIPAVVFVNKMDLAGTERAELLAELKKQLGEGCVDFNGNAARQAFEESLAVCDETLLERYLDGQAVQDKDIAPTDSDKKGFPLSIRLRPASAGCGGPAGRIGPLYGHAGGGRGFWGEGVQGRAGRAGKPADLSQADRRYAACARGGQRQRGRRLAGKSQPASGLFRREVPDGGNSGMRHGLRGDRADAYHAGHGAWERGGRAVTSAGTGADLSDAAAGWLRPACDAAKHAAAGGGGSAASGIVE